MPTGYTAGIVDGSITTFPQFAQICMRAFGATIHMRDDGLNEPFVERTPTDYHFKEIKKAKQLLMDSKELSDDEIISRKADELQQSKIHHDNMIKKTVEGNNRLNSILAEVEKWNPPTEDHKGLKDFMVEQIKITINDEWDRHYHEKELKKINDQLDSMTAHSIRTEIKEKAIKDLEYHTKEHMAEVDRCNKSNKWVSDLINSLNP